jgi:aryl-alcohol dehydrogenase-like predicted oxidoreductase
MHYRELGRTGVSISEIGMGCNRLGEEDQTDAHWVRLVQRAVDLGVTVFDTAQNYQWGRSEEILGRALRNLDDVIIASKISHPRESAKSDFSALRMMKTAEDSLARLQRDCIDIYQLHSPNRQDLEGFDWAEGMVKLKEQGKIRFRGVALTVAAGADADGIWLIEQGLIDVLQITYNIFNIEAEAGLFDVAERNGVGLLVRMPLAQGILTGKFLPGQEISGDHRAYVAGRRMLKRIELAEDLRPLGEEYDGGLTRLAHHFCLTPRAVSATIPGARTLEQLEDNVSASNRSGVSQEYRVKIDRVRTQWEQEYGDLNELILAPAK